MSQNQEILNKKLHLSNLMCFVNIGFQDDIYCALAFKLQKEELGIAAVDRLYPLKPKNPI